MINKKAYLVKNLYKGIGLDHTRNGYGEGVVEAGKEDKNVVVLCADLTDSTRSSFFKKAFPDRFIEIGVAEQNLATVASGLAAAGKIPFISSYAVFSPGRNYEQIRTTIAYNNLPVKIMGAHAGVSVGPDGATHQALEDIAIMRVVPNMAVIVPCDKNETKKAAIALAKSGKPAYMRFAREKTPLFTTDRTPFKIGRAEYYRYGKDITIIACGPLVYQALLAAKDLKKEGIDAAVINSHTIKPLDKKTIIRSAKDTGAIVTVEEHQRIGGLGSAVAELISENYPVPIKRVGIKDRFGESGRPDELLIKFGLTSRKIIKAAKEAIKMKDGRKKER